MPKIALCGPSYTSQSPNADDQLCMNRYPEIIESGEAATRIALYPCPGSHTFTTLTDTPVRGQCKSQLRSFAVGGSIFCEVFANGSKVDYPPIATDGLPVSMAVGKNQILIASAGQAYVFDLTANTLSPIPAGILTNVSQVGYCDGFFLAVLNNSQTFQASALFDATTWPALSVSTINVFIDNILSMLVDHREVWLFGLTKSVVYYDSGASPFPFDVVPGGTIEQGIVAANSPVRLDNSLFWLGGDERGNGVAWRAQGYTPVRVSNYAVEFAWQGYSRIDDAIGYSYQDQGHSFWVLYFPTANKTWVYDVATSMWHERGRWNAANGIFTAHRSQNHVFSFGKHLVGDPLSGKIYQLSIGFFDDDGGLLRWVRRAPHIVSDRKWQFHSQLEIYLESGVGPQPPLTAPAPSITFTLADPTTALWTVSVTNGGLLQTTAGSTSIARTMILNDPGNTTTWQIKVAAGGLLTTTALAFDVSKSVNFLLISPSGTFGWQLGVTAGGLLTTTADNSSLVRGPAMGLRWSDDGGHTWSNEYLADIGQAGEFKKRVIFRRLGRTRNRTYELSGADSVPYRLLDAVLD